MEKALRDDPALVEYLLDDVELKRKWMKLSEEHEKQLAESSRRLGLAEGVLLGLGVALLLGVIAGVLATQTQQTQGGANARNVQW
jgi:hypothetical protein